jgi:prepilin-type N-terminal cleavage/methylation domain-containing protein
LKHIYRISKGLSKGFTLIELAIALAAMSIAIVLVFYGFSSSMRIFNDEMYDAAVSIETQRAMENITADLRGTQGVDSGLSNAASITFWSQDLNGGGVTSDAITYNWTGASDRMIYKTVNSAPSQEISTNIGAFYLTYGGDPVNSVYIRITGQKGTSISTLESSVKLRNK